MSEATKFEPGDVVYLKSGSPELTVERYDEEDEHTVVRWMADGEVRATGFPAACLTKEKPKFL